MNDYTDQRPEGFEETPESLLRRQARAGRRNGIMLPAIAGIAGLVILAALVWLLVFPAKEQPAQTGIHKRTLELGKAGDLPEAGNPVEAARMKSALEDMESRLAGLESQMAANHDRLMGSLDGIRKSVDQNAEHIGQALKTLEALSARLEQLEKRYSSAMKAAAGTRGKEEKAGAPSPQKAPQTGKKYYTVKKNDTLYSIARLNGIALQTLLEINGLKKNAVIHPGDRLQVSP